MLYETPRRGVSIINRPNTYSLECVRAAATPMALVVERAENYLVRALHSEVQDAVQ